MEQMTLPEIEAPKRNRIKIVTACPVSHCPEELARAIVFAKTFYQVSMKVGPPVRDGFYGIISEMNYGDYHGVAWYETKTGIWWDVEAQQPIEGWVVTSWYGLSAELGGRRRRKLLQSLN